MSSSNRRPPNIAKRTQDGKQLILIQKVKINPEIARICNSYAKQMNPFFGLITDIENCKAEYPRARTIKGILKEMETDIGYYGQQRGPWAKNMQSTLKGQRNRIAGQLNDTYKTISVDATIAELKTRNENKNAELTAAMEAKIKRISPKYITDNRYIPAEHYGRSSRPTDNRDGRRANTNNGYHRPGSGSSGNPHRSRGRR